MCVCNRNDESWYYRSLPSDVSDTLTVLFLPSAMTNVRALLRSAGRPTHIRRQGNESAQFHIPSGPWLQHVAEKNLVIQYRSHGLAVSSFVNDKHLG